MWPFPFGGKCNRPRQTEIIVSPLREVRMNRGEPEEVDSIETPSGERRRALWRHFPECSGCWRCYWHLSEFTVWEIILFWVKAVCYLNTHAILKTEVVIDLGFTLQLCCFRSDS
jgi:hypothetical protein